MFVLKAHAGWTMQYIDSYSAGNMNLDTRKSYPNLLPMQNACCEIKLRETRARHFDCLSWTTLLTLWQRNKTSLSNVFHHIFSIYFKLANQLKYLHRPTRLSQQEKQMNLNQSLLQNDFLNISRLSFEYYLLEFRFNYPLCFVRNRSSFPFMVFFLHFPQCI